MKRVLFFNIVAINFILFNCLGQTIPSTFGILKPNLKADTIALLKNRVKKINVQLADYYSDSVPKINFYGSWSIDNDSTKINHCTWTWADTTKTLYWNFYSKFHYIKKCRNKIIEINFKSNSDAIRLKMKHYLNSDNNVNNTKFYCLSGKFEDSYSLISGIKYNYDKGLLTEEVIYNDFLFTNKEYCFLKFLFTYEYY